MRLAEIPHSSLFRTHADFSFADLQAGNRTSIEACLARRTYASFHRCAEGTFGMDGEEHPTIHASGHQAIGAGACPSSPFHPAFHAWFKVSLTDQSVSNVLQK
jgi:hypothetical protein